MDVDNNEYIIALHISEAVGLNLKEEQIVISASLGGNTLETEIVSSAKRTIFNNNLIWETDKDSIKKMKMENLPVKIECFELKASNGQEDRSLIGYILLPIRGVPIISQKKTVSNKPHWHKLIGLNSEWRIQKPEILLLLSITNKKNFDQETDFLNIKNPSVENVETISLEACDTTSMLTSQNGLYIKLLKDEGLLQVGDFETNCDVFIVKLTFKNARNLEHIVNPEEQMNELFRFHYNLLGSPTHCSLIPKGNGLFSIQEKIAINFRTSLKSLSEYFRKVLYIPIDLYYNDTVVGHARFKFDELIKTDNLTDFLNMCPNSDNSLETEGTFMIGTLFDLPPTALKPFVEYIFGIKYLSTTKVGSCEVILDKPQTAEYIDNQAGDHNSAQLTLELPPTINEPISKEECNNITNNRSALSDSVLVSVRENDTKNEMNITPKPTKSEPVISKKSNIESIFLDKNDYKISKNIPRTFSFNLILETVKFTRRPEIGIWQISLHHPKADTPFTIANIELSEISSNVIEFRNLELQIFFASTIDQILNVIESEPCVINIKGPRGMHATADLDSEILLLGTKEKNSGIILMESQAGEKVAMAHIFVYLEDLGINFNSQIRKCPDPKQFMDYNLAYKIVEELEEWKLKQQELFLVELKRKEINHLALLSSEWQMRKKEQEMKLAEKLEQCTLLTNALEEAHKSIKDKGIHQLEQERLAEQIKLELQEIYNIKLMELKEHSRRIEDDLLHKLRLEELKYRELEMSKASVERENEKLRLEIKDLESKITEMRQSFLPREQLAGLFQDLRILSERLDEVQKSKMFYKDQWAKIIREVHKMKSENLYQMELQLKHNRPFELEELLDFEKNELLTEREELNLVKETLRCHEERYERLKMN